MSSWDKCLRVARDASSLSPVWKCLLCSGEEPIHSNLSVSSKAEPDYSRAGFHQCQDGSCGGSHSQAPTKVQVLAAFYNNWKYSSVFCVLSVVMNVVVTGVLTVLLLCWMLRCMLLLLCSWFTLRFTQAANASTPLDATDGLRHIVGIGVGILLVNKRKQERERGVGQYIIK